MIEVCITGIPGTGKTSICDELRRMGYDCRHLDMLATELGCVNGESVDVDCLDSKFTENTSAVESHYSHFLHCRRVVLIECDQDVISERLKERGYSDEKIAENIEAQNSDVIYHEALDRVPATKITRLDSTGLTINEIAERIAGLIAR